MGVYDTFLGTCPKCGNKDFSSQTKLTDCILDYFHIGTKVPEFAGKKVGLKNACYECKTQVTAEFNTDGVLEKFSTATPDFVEGMFGSKIQVNVTVEEE